MSKLKSDTKEQKELRIQANQSLPPLLRCWESWKRNGGTSVFFPMDPNIILIENKYPKGYLSCSDLIDKNRSCRYHLPSYRIKNMFPQVFEIIARPRDSKESSETFAQNHEYLSKVSKIPVWKLLADWQKEEEKIRLYGNMTILSTMLLKI